MDPPKNPSEMTDDGLHTTALESSEPPILPSHSLTTSKHTRLHSDDEEAAREEAVGEMSQTPELHSEALRETFRLLLHLSAMSNQPDTADKRIKGFYGGRLGSVWKELTVWIYVEIDRLVSVELSSFACNRWRQGGVHPNPHLQSDCAILELWIRNSWPEHELKHHSLRANGGHWNFEQQMLNVSPVPAAEEQTLTKSYPQVLNLAYKPKPHWTRWISEKTKKDIRGQVMQEGPGFAQCHN